MLFMPYVLTLSDLQPEDEIDQLFQRLPEVEPPREVITRMLSQIQRLPRPTALPSLSIQDGLAGQSEDTLIVRNEKRDPS